MREYNPSVQLLRSVLARMSLWEKTIFITFWVVITAAWLIGYVTRPLSRGWGKIRQNVDENRKDFR